MFTLTSLANFPDSTVAYSGLKKYQMLHYEKGSALDLVTNPGCYSGDEIGAKVREDPDM